MNNEIALDLTRYDTSTKLKSLVQDTASLAIEASGEGFSRVNPTFLVKTINKTIVPGGDKRDVREMFVKDDVSSEAAEIIIHNLEKDKCNFVYIWISPSGPWPEARIQIGSKQTTPSGRYEYIKRYDISTTANRNSCLQLGQLLASMASEDVVFPQDPDELRGMIFKLVVPEEQVPFEFLSDLIGPYIPEKDAFPSILDGTADKNKARALKTATTVTQSIRNNPHVIFSSPVHYGAYIERTMAKEGFRMDPQKFGCGASNTTFNSTPNISGVSEYNFTNETTSWGYHIGDCVYCGATDTSVGPCSICKSCEKIL